MSEVTMTQKEWPVHGTYVGLVCDKSVEFNYDYATKHSGRSYQKAKESARTRVYGDEIDLALERIINVHYLKDCFEQGYTKDISWPEVKHVEPLQTMGLINI